MLSVRLRVEPPPSTTSSCSVGRTSFALNVFPFKKSACKATYVLSQQSIHQCGKRSTSDESPPKKRCNDARRPIKAQRLRSRRYSQQNSAGSTSGGNARPLALNESQILAARCWYTGLFAGLSAS